MRAIICLLVFVTLGSCKTESKREKGIDDPITAIAIAPKRVVASDDVSLKIFDYVGFVPYLEKNDDKTYVINFWATWCKPCVEEMPYFEKLQSNYKNRNVEVVFVSLDMPRMIDTQLMPFLTKRQLQSEVIMLDDPKQNDWIPKVAKEWSGAIPATLIYNKNKRSFYEQSFTYEELEKEVKKHID
ncbi:TlpA disulfide reductase family protein [Leptobacterium sp. I13]|uniref:TlpA disulfide reductase family protein n=1 Tax=Leptobacterium meishanense TaxID=3128904 RepID=UPI0030EC1267